MEIQVNRKWFSDKSTISEMLIDGVFQCFVLEDVERTEKVYGQTAIPVGRYRINITPSKRFGRLMPLIEHVPGFEGIRIHWGNEAKDTEGCLLLGETRGVDFVGKSRLAFMEFFNKLVDYRGDDVWITIEDLK